MYWQYYGLREEPFGVTPDPRYLYLSRMHAEALASLSYGVESNRGFLALIAPPGTGKTSLLFRILEQFRNTAQTAFLFQTKCSSIEFLRYLMSDLGTDPTGLDLVKMNEAFAELLARTARNGKRTLVVIDEAQNLDEAVLETIRMLSNFEAPESKLLQIIFSGQSGLSNRLAHYELRQLRQRLAAVIHLRALSPGEASEYIDHRLRIAGCSGPDLFTPEARGLLIGESEGIPRKINTHCFNALSLGFAMHSRVIDESMVQQVIDDNNLDVTHERLPFARCTERRPATPVAVPFHPESSETRMKATPGSEVQQDPAAAMQTPHSAPAAIETATADKVVPPQAEEAAHGSLLGCCQLSVAENLVVPHSQPQAPEYLGERPRGFLTFRDTRLYLAVAALAFFVIGYVAILWHSSFGVRRASPESTEERSSVGLGTATSTPPASSGTGHRAVRHNSSKTEAWTLRRRAATATPPRATNSPDSGEVSGTSSPLSIRESTPLTLITEAELLSSTIPEYPLTARRRNVEGTVVLTATIGKDGSVLRVETISGNSMLARAALESVRSWQYRPASMNGKPIEARAKIVLNFSLHNRS
jgi:general secretion pathway protein A